MEKTIPEIKQVLELKYMSFHIKSIIKCKHSEEERSNSKHINLQNTKDKEKILSFQQVKVKQSRFRITWTLQYGAEKWR